MKIGNNSAPKVSSSPISLTYEPIEFPAEMERLLLESHTTHSRKSMVDHGRETTLNREEFTLTTIVCSDSGDREPWRSGSALLVELRYDSNPGLDARAPEDSEQIALQISGAKYLAGFIGAHEDSIGEWDWTITATEVPIRLAEETVQGSLRISGKCLPVPGQLRTAPGIFKF
jgi:hypothetical protein